MQPLDDNSFVLKNDQPKWQPSKTRYLDTFFNEHFTFIQSLGTNPNTSGNQVEKFVRGIASLIPKKEREKILKGHIEDFQQYVKERKKIRGENLSEAETDHCYSLTWLDRLGMICDYQGKAYHIDGNEQTIGVFGMFGEDVKGREIMIMSEEALLALVGKKPKSHKVEDEEANEGGEAPGESG